MSNFVIVVIVGVILGFAVGYIYKEKKKGKVCVGCPYAGECAKKNCGCSCEKEQ